jgi:hypothetical protein
VAESSDGGAGNSSTAGRKCTGGQQLLLLSIFLFLFFFCVSSSRAVSFSLPCLSFFSNLPSSPMLPSFILLFHSFCSLMELAAMTLVAASACSAAWWGTAWGCGGEDGGRAGAVVWFREQRRRKS